MTLDPAQGGAFRSSIAPWLSVRNGAQAVDFYKAAFGATEVYRLETPDGGVVAKLSVDGAEFWLSGESPEHDSSTSEYLGGSVRMILTVADPDAVFLRARAAGAEQVYPVGETTVGGLDASLTLSGITGKLVVRLPPRLYGRIESREHG